MKPWKKVAPWALAGAAGVTGIFAVANLATSVYIQQTLLRPKRKDNRTADLSDFVPEAVYTTTSVSFKAADGFRIAGWLLTPENPNGHAIVVCHGIAHEKRSAVRFVQYLVREGYTLLLIDFRAHGESEGTITTYGLREKEDLLAAVRYLRGSAGIRGKIGVLGASMGASIAIQAAASGTEIDALVLDSPFASLKKVTEESVSRITGLPGFLLWAPLGLAFLLIRMRHQFHVPAVEPARQARFLKCPIFLIHGTRDERIPFHHAIDIYENVTTQKEIWIAENVGHLGAYIARPAEYQKRVLDFFRLHLQTENPV